MKLEEKEEQDSGIGDWSKRKEIHKDAGSKSTEMLLPLVLSTLRQTTYCGANGSASIGRAELRGAQCWCCGC